MLLKSQEKKNVAMTLAQKEIIENATSLMPFIDKIIFRTWDVLKSLSHHTSYSNSVKKHFPVTLFPWLKVVLDTIKNIIQSRFFKEKSMLVLQLFEIWRLSCYFFKWEKSLHWADIQLKWKAGNSHWANQNKLPCEQLSWQLQFYSLIKP